MVPLNHTLSLVVCGLLSDRALVLCKSESPIAVGVHNTYIVETDQLQGGRRIPTITLEQTEPRGTLTSCLQEAQ